MALTDASPSDQMSVIIVVRDVRLRDEGNALRLVNLAALVKGVSRAFNYIMAVCRVDRSRATAPHYDIRPA
jgi:hypothetical protein